jgi:hypothetical protein
VKGDRVTSRLVFHFKDGSLRDETSVFSQRQSFRLISNHLVQKGPTFPQTLDLKIDCASGQVTVRYTDDGLAGFVAPLLGKQPLDTHVWIVGGEAPAFVKSEGSMFLGGPIWRTELVSPVWPEPRPTATPKR